MGQIVFKDICKSFGETKVIENLNLTIEDGKFTVLIGSSGCGKGIKFKLNITVLKRSWQKDFIPLIEELKPDRVKVFRALTLKNANDDIEDTWSISDEEFDYFKIRHKGCDNIVFEDCKEIVGSYLMVDPLGRCMIDKGNEKRLLPFSSFTDGSLFSELDVDKYYARGGDYWSKRGQGHCQ